MASCPSPISSSSPPTAASDANLTHKTSVVCLVADEEDALSKHRLDALPSQSAVAACQPGVHARLSTISYDKSESKIAEITSTPRRELNVDCSRNDNTCSSSSSGSRCCNNNNMNNTSNNINGGDGGGGSDNSYSNNSSNSRNINSVNVAVADDCSKRDVTEVSSSTLPTSSSVVVVDERISTTTNRRTLAASTTTAIAAAAPLSTSTTVVAEYEDKPMTTTTIANSSSPSRRVSPVPSLDLRNHHEDTAACRPPPQSDMSATPTTTPTAAIMRTPPSPRSTVILPLPRVTVTSPSDLCPPNPTSTVQIESPSPQTPPSPPLPPPHPRSVVIVPFPTTLSTATQLSLNTMEPPPLPMDTSALPPPPPYEGFIKDDDGDGGDDSVNGIRRTPDGYGLAHLDNLPSYAVATDLPTYEEAEIAKANEMRENRDRTHGTNGAQVPPTGQQQQQQQQQHMNYPEDERVPSYDPYHLTGVSLGTDWIFLCTFAISFLFNWLGFLISLCITNTVAGRCGALSGLGLSLVKWVVIMKYNTMAQGFMQGDSWVWWILMICGFLLFLRGCIQYVNMKYEWRRIFVRLQQMYFS